MQETPLHIAARVSDGGEKCVQMLLKSGCDANMSRADGGSPLHVAAGVAHAAVVRLLLADGAEPTLADQSGETPLQVACATSLPGTLAVVHLLLDHVRNKCGSTAGYVNARNVRGETSLHAASNQHQPPNVATHDRDIAQILLQAGADVSLDTNEVSHFTFPFIWHRTIS